MTQEKGNPVTSGDVQNGSEVAKPVAPAAKPTPSGVATVWLINQDEHAGRYLVQDIDSKEVYLVGKSKLNNDRSDQEIGKRDLESADRPYNLDDVIDALFEGHEPPKDRQAVRVALYMEGVITKSDVADLGEESEMKKALTLKLRNRGIALS